MRSLSLSLAARKKRVDPTCSRYRWGRSHGAARAGPGEGGRPDEGHFHVCRTALNTHSLGCVSERTASCDLRSSYPRLKHRTD